MKTIGYSTFLVFSIVLGLSVGEVLPQSSAKEPIKVGVFLDLSGPTSSFGQSTLNGIEMATEQINNAGGINGRRVELLVKDDLGEPTEAATVVYDLIDRKKVHALLGEVASSRSLAAAPIAQNAKVPMITPASTHPIVTRRFNYIFRACFTDPIQAEALAEFAAKTLKAKRVAFLIDNSNDYSQTLAQAFEKSFRKFRGAVIVRQVYMHGDRDFMAQLVSIKSFRPDLIFVPGYDIEAGLIARQARQIGFKKPLLGGDGWDTPQLWYSGGASLNGSYISNHYASDSPSPANKEFTEKYKTRYQGLEPNALAALGYDAMKLLADAIGRAATTDGAALREALAATRNFAGVTGVITEIDKNRDVIKAVVILKLQGGRFIYQESVRPAR
jgi:branched-chain amino acid transport system substrate-binding protein